MKVAIIGKGGAGKTTTSSVLARHLARTGSSVIALDCDSNSNLGLSLGIGMDATEHLISMRERLDEGDEDHATDPADLLARFGTEGPDDVRLAVVARIEHPNPGCQCCGLSADELLASMDAPDRVVIADMEAGIGTLTRVAEGAIDVAVIVTEPTTKSLAVAERALGLARQKGIRQIFVVANRIVNEADMKAVTARFPAVDVMPVPDDDAIVRADRDGIAPLDFDPDAPAVIALMRLADRLAPEPVAVG